MKYTIHSLSRILGVTQETIRHYKNLGLIMPEQDPVNGYYYYDNTDAIQTLSIRRYRSMESSMNHVHDVINGHTAQDQLTWLKQREHDLKHQIELLQTDLEHTQQIYTYMNMTLEKQGNIELVDWKDDFGALYLLGKNVVPAPEAQIKQWADSMPYTYLTLKIPKEQLQDEQRTTPYDVQIGLGCISKYRKELALDESDPVQIVPGGLSIRTFIATDDPFSIHPSQLDPMLRYIREHNFQIPYHSTGWILVTDYSATKKKYFILIRVRIQ